MELLFFDAAGAPLFSRSDHESGTWTVEEMSLQALFPYDPDKVIERGMRIGFTDDSGTFQAFEIRQAKTCEPDHYQEITAEHIAVSELTDEFFATAEWDTITAQAALTQVLSGTGWSVGTVTSSGTSSADVSNSNVWQCVRTIESNWNVYITPRVTVSSSGITGKYLDIAPAGGTWSGMRLSLDKNADQVGVTWDDTNLKTALYAYGGNVEADGEDESEPLTFADVVWADTDEHPAKPLNQIYLEDPDATALYGRNGRARFGYYQNSEITDPEILLEKTWEVLKTVNAPEVQIDCLVRDLYRMGYADEPIRLHDTAIIEIRQTNVSLQREIVKVTVDLVDPTATRVTVGRYIPNIIYINRDTNSSATGGGGGSGGQSNRDYELTEFHTAIEANEYQISLRAWQTDMTEAQSILAQAGMELNSQGVLIYATDNVNNIMSKLNVQADRISLVVEGSGSSAAIKAASIVASINDSGSAVQIDGDKIELSSLVTAINASQVQINAENTTISGYLSTNNVDIGWLEVLNSLSVDGATELSTVNVGSLTSDGGVDCATLKVGGTAASWQSATVRSYTLGSYHYMLYSAASGNTTPSGTIYGRAVTATSSTTIYYLGHT